MSKATSAIFPTAFAHFMSLCHILVILEILQTFSLFLYLLWWSVVSGLCYYHYPKSLTLRRLRWWLAFFSNKLFLNWASQVALVVKNLPMRETWEMWVPSLGQEDLLEEGMATNPSILAWRIPWAEEPGGLPSMVLQRFGYNKATQQQLDFQFTSVHLLSHVWLFATPWTLPHQAPLPMGFSRKEYWSGLPCPPPGDLPNPGVEPRFPAL